MSRRLITSVAIVLLTLTGLALQASPVKAAGPITSPPKQYYLSLGDSLAYGFQQAKLNAELAKGTVDASTFNTGYTDAFGRMLKAINPSLQVVNLGCPGETTSSFLTGCAFSAQEHLPLHVAYTGSQLAAAVAFLKAHPGQVSPITISIGANDVVHVATQTCKGVTDTACLAANLPAALALLAKNLQTILATLRQAAPDAEIIVTQLYNPFAALDASTNAFAIPVNGIIAQTDAAFGAITADPFTPFNLAQPQPQTICALTLFCTSLNDIHASDAGYLVMAQQFFAVSGYQSLLHGFFVSWVSAVPGQGLVYFGSGPGCLGLVQVATQDLGPAGGTVHLVYVTGNDLPGTVGNSGILPGQTYTYETVTVTGASSQIDNNAGKCYTASQATGTSTGTASNGGTTTAPKQQ
jgi:lysophospholipase L1-like esterase